MANFHEIKCKDNTGRIVSQLINFDMIFTVGIFGGKATLGIPGGDIRTDEDYEALVKKITGKAALASVKPLESMLIGKPDVELPTENEAGSGE